MVTSFRWLWILLGVAGVVVLLVGGFVLRVLWSTGEFKSIEPHFAGTCELVEGLVGAEDLTIHPRTGVAYISSADHRASFRGGPARGAIFAYDLTSEAPELRNLTPGAAEDFQPLGISLYVGEDGHDVLYVINLARGRHTIEVYDLIGTELVRRKTLSDPLLVTPNDLVAVGRDRLYVSNDHAHASGLDRTLEDYLRRSISNIVYYDGERFVEAASGLRYPNGVNVSADGETLYAASTTGKFVFVFDIDPASGRLEERRRIPIGTGVDNIEIDEQGDLWIGAHAKLLTFLKHAADASQLAPSQVIRVREPRSESPEVEEVFLSLGADLSGSSVGAVYGGRLLVGSVLDEGILDCRMSP